MYIGEHFREQKASHLASSCRFRGAEYVSKVTWQVVAANVIIER